MQKKIIQTIRIAITLLFIWRQHIFNIVFLPSHFSLIARTSKENILKFFIFLGHRIICVHFFLLLSPYVFLLFITISLNSFLLLFSILFLFFFDISFEITSSTTSDCMHRPRVQPRNFWWKLLFMVFIVFLVLLFAVIVTNAKIYVDCGSCFLDFQIFIKAKAFTNKKRQEKRNTPIQVLTSWDFFRILLMSLVFSSCVLLSIDG